MLYPLYFTLLLNKAVEIRLIKDNNWKARNEAIIIHSYQRPQNPKISSGYADESWSIFLAPLG